MQLHSTNLKSHYIMKSEITYKSFVIETNATLKKECKSINGAVKMLVNMENLTTEVAKILRIYAGKNAKGVALPIASKDARNNIVRKVIEVAKERNTLTRKATAKELASGASERVERTTFSPFWVLQQLYTLTK
jgi:hypothetical protein